VVGDILDFGISQKLPGIFPGGIIIGTNTDGLVTLLEGICRTYYLLIQYLIKRTFNPFYIFKNILPGFNVLNSDGTSVSAET
jgi:hypothetical protein